MRGVTAVLALLLSVVPAAADPLPRDGVPVTIAAQPIPLSSQSAEVSRVGKLTYLGGWALFSDHPLFGGWSAMVLRGDRLTAFSDAGAWMSARFAPEEGVLADPRIGTLYGGDPADIEKKEFDTESAVPLGSAGYLLAFEQTHRVERLGALGGALTRVSLPPRVFKGLGRNAGYEAMAWDHQGGLLLLPENGVDWKGRLTGYRVSSPVEDPVAVRFYVKPPKDMSVTALKMTQDGTGLAIGRSYSPLRARTSGDGTHIHVLRFQRDQLAEDAAIDLESLAFLKAPFSVDNFEALALLSEDPLRFAVLSDDNFSSSQRTLLMVFEVNE